MDHRGPQFSSDTDARPKGERPGYPILPVYKHTQTGYLLIVAYIIAPLLLLAALIPLARSDEAFRPIALIGPLILLLTLALFATLTVTVDSEKIELRFGIGLIRRRFRIQDIQSFREARNRWYYGWGIRYTLHGWLFNVSGLTAIELQLKNGKKYRIGTDDPDGLSRA